MILRASCKINIGLDILRRRADGYHDLATVMYPVRELYDTLSVEPNGTGGVRFTQSGIAVDCPAEDNICVKAYALMHRLYGVQGVDISLDKRVPFGAGLGGGSADGTAVLLALNELFSLALPQSTLISLAAELGSDMPFFVINEPQLCSGRGEIMAPIELPLAGLTLVVAKPNEGVSTKEAYSGVVPRIPCDELAVRLQRPLDEWRDCIVNDFEHSIFATHPRIAALKQSLLDGGALYASMSGSGSAVFGLFADAQSAKKYTPPFDGVFIHRERL